MYFRRFKFLHPGLELGDHHHGFTLVELMIVVAVIGILAAVAIPKFAGLLDRGKEATTRSNIGLFRSAISLYYADNESYYPAGATGADAATLTSTLVPKYLPKIPASFIHPHHAPTSVVNNVADAANLGSSDSGEWGYVSVFTDPSWGTLAIQCTHADSRGLIWTAH